MQLQQFDIPETLLSLHRENWNERALFVSVERRRAPAGNARPGPPRTKKAIADSRINDHCKSRNVSRFTRPSNEQPRSFQGSLTRPRDQILQPVSNILVGISRNGSFLYTKKRCSFQILRFLVQSSDRSQIETRRFLFLSLLIIWQVVSSICFKFGIYIVVSFFKIASEI